MGLAEAITVKAHHHLPDIFNDFPIHTLLTCPLQKAGIEVSKLFFLEFFGDHFSECLGFSGIKSCQVNSSLAQLFLKDHDP